MAKKQTFGDKALASKQSTRKMAKVIMAFKSKTGNYNYRESIVELEKANDFIKDNK
jgi:hypothetical protein